MLSRISFSAKLTAVSAFLLSLITAASVTAQTPPTPFEIKIERAERFIAGDTLFVPVKKTAGDLPMGGYEFLIGYNTDELDCLGVDPGEPVYGPYTNGIPIWNYFDYELDPVPGCEPDCPTGLVRITALAASGPNNPYPAYQTVDDGENLLYLKFRIVSAISADSIFSAIRFFWSACDDNIVYYQDDSAEMLGLSSQVIEYDGTDITDPADSLPSFHGAADYCYSDSASASFVTFMNGGVGIFDFDLTPFTFSIGIPEDLVPLGGNGTVTVRKAAGSEPMGGFDFLIGYDTEILTVTGVTPGGLFAVPGDYEWEFFDYTTGTDPGCEGDDCAGGFIRIVGVADVNDGQPHEAYQSIADGTEICHVDFGVTSDSAYECYFVPIRFYWADCGDNMVAFQYNAEDHSGVSGLQYSFYDQESYRTLFAGDYEAGFPTFRGAQNSCFAGDVDRNMIRSVHYGNGAIAITCSDLIDDCGDINLNGISFEIADAVVFMNFLLYGVDAFTIAPEAQADNSDVNGDGRRLTVQDLVFMEKVIIGAIAQPIGCDSPIPYDTLPGMLEFIDTDSSILVNGNFSDTIGAIHLCFYAPELQDSTDYSITAFDPIGSFEVGSNIHDDSLKVLISAPYTSWDEDPLPPGEFPLLEIFYSGSGPVLEYASAAGRWADYVELQITGTPDLPPQFAPYPDQLENGYFGGFAYDFGAADNDILNDSIRYEIISGPGEIDPVTGEYLFAAVCEEPGSVYTLVVCASDVAHPCETTDPQMYAQVELLLNNDPPILGDVNGDGTIDLEDIVYLVAYIYMDDDRPRPDQSVAEVNQLPGINILDIVYLIRYLYTDGPPPECP
jgi:hypothetical protein